MNGIYILQYVFTLVFATDSNIARRYLKKAIQ